MTDFSKIAGIKEVASGLKPAVATQSAAPSADTGFNVAELAARRASLRASKDAAMQRGVDAGILPPEAIARAAVSNAALGNLRPGSECNADMNRTRANGIG